MIKIGSVGMLDSDNVAVMNLDPWEIFIITGIQDYNQYDDIDEMTYFIKTTESGYETFLFEKDIVVLCEPDCET